MNNDKSLTEKLVSSFELLLREKSIEDLGFKKNSSQYNLIKTMTDAFFVSGMEACIKLVMSGEFETIRKMLKKEITKSKQEKKGNK